MQLPSAVYNAFQSLTELDSFEDEMCKRLKNFQFLSFLFSLRTIKSSNLILFIKKYLCNN